MTITVISDNTGADYSGTDDCYLEDNNPTTNHGTDVWNYISADYFGLIRFMLLKFTGLSNISASQSVSDVTLSLYMVGTDGAASVTGRLNRVLLNWVEAQATYNNYATSTAWNTAGAAGSGTDISATTSADLTLNNTTGAYKDWNAAQLTTDVGNMVSGSYNNYGWRLFQQDATANAHRAFAASEHTDGQRPKLTVTHSAAAGGLLKFLEQTMTGGFTELTGGVTQ